MKTLAAACVQALPVLTSIPTAYAHEAHAELLYELCVALVQQGIGTPEIWAQCEGSPITFAHEALQKSIGEERRNLLERNVEYHLQISDVADRGGYDTPLDDGRLMATVECSGAGFLRFGPALRALESEAAGLGAAFYFALTHALYRIMRLYNHDDALQYEERLREYAEEDEDNPGQYEFPEVKKALPEYLRRHLALDYPEQTCEASALIRKHRHGRFRAWFERLRKIQRLARLPRQGARDLFDEAQYDSGPLPCLIVVFEANDAIQACFDEEAQSMLECSAEPAFGVVFSPRDPVEVRQAARAVGRFLALNVELFSFIEELQQWEERHEGTGRDRGEPSLRAA